MSIADLVVPQAVEVEIAGVSYSVPAIDAAGWLCAVGGNLRWSVLPGLLPAGERAALIERVMLGEVTNEDVWAAACDVLRAVSGREWWKAVRLVGYAEASGGELYGNLLLTGVRPDGIPFAAWCAAMFAMITRNMDDKQRLKFDAQFLMPPDGDVSAAEEWDTGIPEGWG